MLNNLCNRQSLIHIPIQHFLDQINAVFRERHKGYPQRVIQDLVDVVEGIFFINDGVKEDSKSPDVLFLTAIRFALEDFRRSII
jgi:hypothetical protein